MAVPFIGYEDTRPRLEWSGALDALRDGHRRPKAEVADLFLGPDDATLLNRGAFIPGLGYGVKAVTVFDVNPQHGLPTVQGAMFVFEAERGRITAIVDSRLVTEMKTAADSVLGASYLARPDSRHLLIVGAGTVARSLVEAYPAGVPSLRRISVWARRPEQAEALLAEADSPLELAVATDLARSAAEADIIACATMARDPVLKGDWVRPGTHVDLIGAFKADMREADDALVAKARLYVDSRETTIGHIGELTIPIERGVISEDDVLGDLYDMVPADGPLERPDDAVTVFKNGGGAHLDLMIATWIADAAAAG